MEDIEDLLIGSATPPGFRLPLAAAVGVGTKRNQLSSSSLSPSPAIPGTQVPFPTSLPPPSSSSSSSFFFLFFVPSAQTIFIKTFGCSHNQASAAPFYILSYLRIYYDFIFDLNRVTVNIWLVSFLLLAIH